MDPYANAEIFSPVFFASFAYNDRLAPQPPMTPERFRLISELYDAAAVMDPAERTRFIEQEPHFARFIEAALHAGPKQ